GVDHGPAIRGRFAAGPAGSRHLTVHQRRHAPVPGTGPDRSPRTGAAGWRAGRVDGTPGWLEHAAEGGIDGDAGRAASARAGSGPGLTGKRRNGSAGRRSWWRVPGGPSSVSSADTAVPRASPLPPPAMTSASVTMRAYSRVA